MQSSHGQLLRCLGAALILFGLSGPGYSLSFTMGDRGLSSLTHNGWQFLATPQAGDAAAQEVTLERADGTTYSGDLKPLSNSVKRRTDTQSFAWGRVDTTYAQAEGKLRLIITITNTSPDKLITLRTQFATLTFPATPDADRPDGGMMGWPPSSKMSSSPVVCIWSERLPAMLLHWTGQNGGSLVWANADMAEPFSVMIPNNANKDYTAYPFASTWNGTLASGKTISGELDLKFGAPDEKWASAVGPYGQRYAAQFPFTMTWTDRRPIGTEFLGGQPDYNKFPDLGHPPKNMTGWFFNDPTVDTTTEEGKKSLRARLIKRANGNLQQLRKANAQGIMVWDTEGARYGGVLYYGSPDNVYKLAPELAYKDETGLTTAQAFYKVYTDAGFKVGNCIRPQVLRFNDDGAAVGQRNSPDPAQTLIEKIDFANREWGATLFYTDSTVVTGRAPNKWRNSDDSLNADIFETIRAKRPNVILFPENESGRYFAYECPLNDKGPWSCSDNTRVAYPGAGGVTIHPDQRDMDKRWGEYVASVQAGNTMMFHAWFSGEDDYMRRLWADAGYLPSDVRMTSPMDGKAYPDGGAITFTSAASDRDGAIAKVEYYAQTTRTDRVKLGEAISAPYKFTWKGAPNGTYVVYARAIDDKGLSGWTAMNRIKVGTGVLAPEAPISLSATPDRGASVNLTWLDMATDETGFAIERQDGTKGKFVIAGTVQANQTQFVDHAAKAGRTYAYRVCAVNAGGRSSYSNVVTAKVQK